MTCMLHGGSSTTCRYCVHSVAQAARGACCVLILLRSFRDVNHWLSQRVARNAAVRPNWKLKVGSDPTMGSAATAAAGGGAGSGAGSDVNYDPADNLRVLGVAEKYEKVLNGGPALSTTTTAASASDTLPRSQPHPHTRMACSVL